MLIGSSIRNNATYSWAPSTVLYLLTIYLQTDTEHSHSNIHNSKTTVLIYKTTHLWRVWLEPFLFNSCTDFRSRRVGDPSLRAVENKHYLLPFENSAPSSCLYLSMARFPYTYLRWAAPYSMGSPVDFSEPAYRVEHYSMWLTVFASGSLDTHTKGLMF